MNSLILELVRQALRWLALFLIAKGMPPSVAEFLGHPDVTNFVAGLVVYAVADGGWLIAKIREWRARRAT